MVPRSERPGIAKVRRVPLVRSRSLTLVALEGGAIAQRLAAADVMSEGAMAGDRYFGSTDVALEVDLRERETVALVAARDPHVRIWLVRLARREACSRAEGSLGTLRAEITVAMDARGLRLRVEVEAPAERAKVRTTVGA